MLVEEYKKLFPTLQSRDLYGHKKKVHCVAWNGNGKKLASGSVDKTARVWNFEDSRMVRDIELVGHSDGVDQLCWDPTNPESLATASADRSVRIWDARSGKCISTINTTGENINICWSPSGHNLVVGNKGDVITIIDANKFKILKTVKFPFEVNEMLWNNDGSLFFLTTGLGNLEVMKYPELKSCIILQAHTANIYCIQFDPTGKYFALGGADALVSLWDVNEFICVRTFKNLDYPVRCMSFSHDGQLIASGSEDLVIDISHVETGEHVFSLPCEAAMNAVAWHPKELLLATAEGQAPRQRFGVDQNLWVQIDSVSANRLALLPAKQTKITKKKKTNKSKANKHW